MINILASDTDHKVPRSGKTEIKKAILNLESSI